MPRKKAGNHSDTGKPLPHCNALLICEKVTQSQITAKITIHNLIEKFGLRVFPGRSTPFSIFLEVYDGIGRYPITVEFNDLADGSTIAETKLHDLDFPDRLARIQVTVPVELVRLSQPGRYELVVFVGGQQLASQHFNAEVDDGGK
jgi:hypothetical protein